jgi:hypothetical protein
VVLLVLGRPVLGRPELQALVLLVVGSQGWVLGLASCTRVLMLLRLVRWVVLLQPLAALLAPVVV